jgi:hypothetical protein
MPLHRFLALVCRSDGARSIETDPASAQIYRSMLESAN